MDIIEFLDSNTAEIVGKKVGFANFEVEVFSFLDFKPNRIQLI
jgi:hypothetical protein